MGVPVERAQQDRRGLAARASTGSSAATSTWSSTPPPARARAPTAGRSAAPPSRHGIPCLTTLAAGVSAARAIASARRDGEPRGALPAGAARARGRRAPSAQRGRRGASGVAARTRAVRPAAADGQRPSSSSGAYRVLRVADPDGPRAAPGPVRDARRRRALGRGRGRAPLPAARVLRSRAGSDGEAHFLLEDVGPGTRRLCELRRRRAAVGARAARRRLHARRDRAAGRCSSAAASGSRRSRSCRTRSAAGMPSDACCSASATRRARARRGAAATARCVATDDGSAGHHGLVTDLLGAELERDAARGRLRLRPGRRCSRPCARSAQRASVPAQLALEAGMACGFGACFGCVVPRRGGGYLRVCVDGPVIDAAELERVDEHAGAPA